MTSDDRTAFALQYFVCVTFVEIRIAQASVHVHAYGDSERTKPRVGDGLGDRQTGE